MVFMASTISRVWPAFTVSPTLTKAAAPGLGELYAVPTMGDFTAPGWLAGSGSTTGRLALSVAALPALAGTW